MVYSLVVLWCFIFFKIFIFFQLVELYFFLLLSFSPCDLTDISEVHNGICFQGTLVCFVSTACKQNIPNHVSTHSNNFDQTSSRYYKRRINFMIDQPEFCVSFILKQTSSCHCLISTKNKTSCCEKTLSN